MRKIFIVGNPNTGKSTLFNNLTKSDEHTGNWHGVTVEAKAKTIKFFGEQIEVYDLPGMYSLNSYSFEEEVAKKTLLKNQGAKVIYIIDANTIERNLFLLMQLKKFNFNIKIVINNYKYFQKQGGTIDIKKLESLLKIPCVFFDAKKEKCTKQFLNFESVDNNDFIYNQNEKFNKNNFSIDNKIENNLTFVDNCRPEDIYREITYITSKCVKVDNNYVYGKSKRDKYILNPIVFFFLFVVGMFFSLYLIFFLLGPKLSSGVTFILNSIVRTPFLYVLKQVTDNAFLLALFDEGIMSACFAVCSFLPQVCLLYIFLSILENSGLISRFAFMADDFLNKLGLNGKCVYTMLMGFGCNTTATLTAKNMPDKNSRIKTVMITPFMSCTAKLPIYSVILSAVLGANNVFVVAGLYLLGIAVALTLSIIFEKTILKSKNTNFLIEFPPLKLPEFKDVAKTSAKSSRVFLSKVFGIIVSMSVIVWILSNVSITFKYTADYQSSILYLFCGKLNIFFKPLGFNSQAVVCTLIVGLVAKELIVSTMMIFNHSTNLAGLIYSLTLPTSLIFFDFASSISFLVFVLLYAPCISNFAVMIKEIGWKYSIISVLCQFIIAYSLAYITFNLFSINILKALIGIMILIALITIFIKLNKCDKLKTTIKCQNCNECGKCL